MFLLGVKKPAGRKIRPAGLVPEAIRGRSLPEGDHRGGGAAKRARQVVEGIQYAGLGDLLRPGPCQSGIGFVNDLLRGQRIVPP